MGNVVVKTTDSGTPVLVKDLGRLTYGNVERRGILGKDAIRPSARVLPTVWVVRSISVVRSR